MSFPLICPSADQVGKCTPSCGLSPSPPAPQPPVIWAGVYQVQGDCSLESDCCCLSGAVRISQFGNIVTITSNQCYGIIDNVTMNVSSNNSNIATFSYNGTDYEVIRSPFGEKVLTVNDLSAPSCTTTASCIAGACAGPSRGNNSPLVLIITSIAILKFPELGDRAQ